MSVTDKIKQFWKRIFVPTSTPPFTFIILLENLLSIYRNLCYYGKKCRVLIYFRIMIEIAITMSCLIIHSTRILPYSTSANVVYFYMNSVGSVIIMLLGCYSSKKFKKLLLFIEGNNLYFANDEIFQRNLKRREYEIKCGLIISNCILILVLAFKYVGEKLIGANENVLSVLYILNSRLSDWRCTYQYVALYCILFVMSEQVDCITRAVTKTRIAISTVEQRHTNIEDSSGVIEIRKFDELSTVFTNIKECSKLFNKIYGLQLVMMLALATVYCIMFMYTMAFLSVKGYKNVGNLMSNILKLLMYFLLLLLLSMGAQKKQNSVNNLRRQLGKLLINHVVNDAHYKATKDFLRLVSTRSIMTETLGSIRVDMTLIPSFIMFITSYTVIALQFNNIV